MAEDDAQQRFTQLFEATYALVLAYTARRVPAEQADDLVADVYVSAWTNLEHLPVPELPWLYRTAWNAIGNHRRSVRRRSLLAGRLVSDARTTAGPRDPGDQVVSADRARSAMNRLRGKDREAIQLLCWEQVSLSDAALVLGCSEATLTVRLHRARRKLAAHLQTLEESSDSPDPVIAGLTNEAR